MDYDNSTHERLYSMIWSDFLNQASVLMDGAAIDFEMSEIPNKLKGFNSDDFSYSFSKP